jgi:hypothetical protein
MAGVGVGLVGALWIVRGTVVRGDFSAKIGWEGSCGVGRESRDRETVSTRTITKERFGLHEKWRKDKVDEITQSVVLLLLLHYYRLDQTRTRTIAARVSTFSTLSNEPATFSSLRLAMRTKPYWTAE